MALGRTICIVGTEDLIHDTSLLVVIDFRDDILVGCVLGGGAVQLHQHVTADISGMGGVTQATAVGIAMNGSGKQADLGRVVRVVFTFALVGSHSRMLGVHMSQGTAAIDIAPDDEVGGCVQFAYFDIHVAFHIRVLTIAAAMHIGRMGGICSYGAALHEHFHISHDRSTGVAAAIDTRLDFAGDQRDLCTGVDVGLVTATVDITHDDTLTLTSRFVDFHLGILRVAGWGIGSQVAATEDGSDVDRLCAGIDQGCLLYQHLHMAQRCSVHVVTAEHATGVQHRILACGIARHHLGAVHCHQHIAIDLGRSVVMTFAIAG